ncbi:MAG TPA: 2-C-methyl-D-erythritol 2,4-cyclodiphosphate synthase [Gemmatimonadaceae bacterium]|nr:2-C-methyl-D-erythritol 2,4-cyclodiphosphate synthase [Gemmatimonadaceae bacterium]
MTVRFQPAARKAIDFAMVEMERIGDQSLSSLHVLLGLLEPTAEGSQAALRLLGVNPAALQLDARRDIHLARTGVLSPEVADAPELVLERAGRISEQCGATDISDADILMASAQDQRTWAGRLLASSGVTPPLLWGVFPEARGVLRAPGSPDPLAGIEMLDVTFPPTFAPSLPVRTGIGYDSHRFAVGGPLILGGVEIPGDVKLVGHSDADAVCHALTDAILGGAGAGDIGELFPDTEAVNEGRNSIEMLKLACTATEQRGWRVAQVDVTVIMERPKLLPHREPMRAALATALGLPADCVSIKAKTNEGMGWVGRGEGIACMAVATLIPVRAVR